MGAGAARYEPMRMIMRIRATRLRGASGEPPTPRRAIKHTLRQATNVTLPPDLLAEARKLSLNVFQACELGLKAEIARARRAQWLEENREAIASSNDYVERHGIPLAEFRQF